MKQFFLFSIALTLFFSSSCDSQSKKNKTVEFSGDLIIFHAGSLSVPFKEIIASFNQFYPNVNVLTEAAGSRSCARKITDLHRDCDIMASADYTVIDNLLIPDHASWNIRFATNEMALAFTPKSRYANEIDKNNWYNIFLREDVIFGRSDPNSDPCGYRSVLSCKLAEQYYDRKGLADKLLNKDQNFIRPKETDLLALLESNAIDYVFIYRSVAEQHQLKFITLPDSINLKNPALADYYATVDVNVSGKKPGETLTKKGEPMVYSITVIDQAPNKVAAEKFIEFLLSKNKGMEIMKTNGQPSLVPSYSDSYNNIPEKLKTFAKEDY